jgi:peroxiredoxin
MHKDLAAEGLVCISVSVDPLEDRDKTLKFLQQQNATFPNFLLDEAQDLWQDKWKIKGPPAIFVFDREGRRARRFDDNPDKPYEQTDVEKLVKELLRAKK